MKLRERATTSTNGAEAGPLDCPPEDKKGEKR
jgi:hypothetical protein